MKNFIIWFIFLFIIVCPPNQSAAKIETTNDTLYNYLLIKNKVLKYQVEKRLDLFNQLYQSVIEETK